MKKLLLLSSLAIFAACSGKESENRESKNVLENFSFSIDTLVVDVGEEIFMPGAYSNFEISEEKDRVFAYYEPDLEVHEIDLISLKLIKRHKFDKDGPNMIPKYLNYMQNLNKTELFFASSVQAGIFKKSGEKVRSISLQPENYAGLRPDFTYSMGNGPLISPDKTKLFSLPNDGPGTAEGLAILDIEGMSGKFLNLPALEMTKNFRVVFRQGNGSTSSGESQRIKLVNGQIIIDSGATSDIYLLDQQTDSLRLVTFPHQLVPKSKTGEFPNEVDSNERRREITREINKQISFSQFFWDESHQIYFRMAQMNYELNEAKRQYTADIYLFAYDEKFNLIGETKVDGLDFMPTRGFARENKLYFRWVIEENPAFVVYTLNFQAL